MEMSSALQGGVIGLYAASFVLGLAHALEPGHGKTVVAAYLVGSRGRNIDAVFLGLIVTLTHSFSVIVLGIIGRMSAGYVDDQTLHVYLGTVSSALILAVGFWMIYRTVFRGGHHGHSHDHGHTHDHDGHHHCHDEGGETHCHTHGHEHGLGLGHHQTHIHSAQGGGYLRLTLLGVSGGLVPCPAAFALLLASVSAGKISMGLTLVVIFSLGLAAALVGIGLAVVNAASFANRFVNLESLGRRMSVASALLVTAVGGYTLYASLRHVL